MFTLRGHADSVNAVYFLPYTNTLVTASADKTLPLWDTRTVGTPPPVDPVGQLLACAGGDETITILDTSSEQVRIAILKRLSEEWWVFLQEWSLCGHEECVWSVVFSPTAQTLLSSAADGSVIVLRLRVCVDW